MQLAPAINQNEFRVVVGATDVGHIGDRHELGRIELVPVADVAYIRGAHNYSELVLVDGRCELHDKSLEKLAAVLPEGFERIHKSFLVRFADIAAIHTREGSQYEAELKSGVCLPIGRTRSSGLRARLI